MSRLFEIKSKDLASRIGVVSLNSRLVETPLLFPVYNPLKPVIPIETLKSVFGCKALMTNAYTLLKNPDLRGQAESRGLHDLLGFEGLIATDSGSFQLMSYGAVETSNTQIIEFQEKIGSDIGSFLDIPSLPDAFKPRVESQLITTLERAQEAEKAQLLVNAGVQGGKYLDLREKAAKELGARFPLVAVGGIVPLMEAYRFAELVDVIATVKKNIPANTLVHAFGLGHPMVFGLAAALGCDFFDSAAYALYAQDDRYLTSYGTVRLEDLEYVGCVCPVCREHALGLKNLYGQERIEKLAYHNLFVSYAELNHIKQAISRGRLFDYLATRCRAHPALFEGFLALQKHMPWLRSLDLSTKPCGLFYSGVESSFRPEVLNAKERLKRVGSEEKIDHPLFGLIPVGLLEIYPFGQSIGFGEVDRSIHVADLDKLRQMADYQFGEGAGSLIPDNVVIKKSRKTKRIRWVYHKKELFLTVRASDHFLLPKMPYAVLLHEHFKSPRLRVVLTDDPDATQCVREGKSVMCKFVEDVDENLLCQDECLVVDSEGELIRVGTLHLSPKEIMDFDSGMAVRVR